MRILSIAFLSAAFFIALLSADDVGPNLVGTVESAAADTLTVRLTDGRTQAVRLDARTRYVRDDRDASQADLAKGARVVVEGEHAGGTWTAHVVRIGVAKPVARSDAHAGGHHGPGGARQPPKAAGGHEGHGAAAGTAADQAGGHAMEHGAMDSARLLFQSDMTSMAGMTPRDPTAGMAMPDWRWMTMGIVRGQYNRQGGPSGEEAVESTNWSMVMGQGDVAGGRVTVMMMNSLEPATLRNGGTPQIFQTGETFEGRELVDRQHPHDFVMNLSATYRRPIGEGGTWWLQLAPRGEPALGPTAYMHRASAGENPSAILSHHFHDSTHITDSVVTGGIGWRCLAVEGSVFHGEEPDEGRWDVDPGGLDSVSGRVKMWLSDRWSVQASYGFLESPEALEEGDVRRATVSLHYGETGSGPFAATFAAGRNVEGHGTFYGYVLEAAYRATRSDELYVRAEQVDRDRHLLESKGRGDEAQEGETDDIVEVRALTLGYVRDLKRWPDVRVLGDLNIGLGADVTAYDVPSDLESVYGESPVSVHGFLRVRWGRPHSPEHGHAMKHE